MIIHWVRLLHIYFGTWRCCVQPDAIWLYLFSFARKFYLQHNLDVEYRRNNVSKMSFRIGLISSVKLTFSISIFLPFMHSFIHIANTWNLSYSIISFGFLFYFLFSLVFSFLAPPVIGMCRRLIECVTRFTPIHTHLHLRWLNTISALHSCRKRLE